ncbi:cyclic nucleotide-binding domain-containing protein [Magnetococcales bacterium HHB-1]
MRQPIIFFPQSYLKTFWNYLILIGSFWYTQSIPIRIAIEEELPDWFIHMDMLFMVIFFLDILVQARTVVALDGELIKDPKEIWLHYKKSWFFVDLIAAIPFDLIAASLGYSKELIALLRLIKVIKLYSLFRSASRALPLKRHARFSLTLFWVLSVVNSAACGWMILYPKVEGVPLDVFYIKAMYWSVTTLTTVGYGDITPGDMWGEIYAMCVMLLGVGIYGFVAGNVTTLLVSSNSFQMEQRRKLETLIDFMRQYSVPLDVQHDVISFYNHYLLECARSSKEVVFALPESMQKSLKTFANISLIQSVSLFKGVSKDCLHDLARCLQSEVFPSRQTIIRAGEEGNEIYFLVHGVVAVTDKKGARFAKLRSGDFFGELALLGEQKQRYFNVETISHCDAYRLGRKDFNHIMDKYPEFKDRLIKRVEKRYRGKVAI